MFFKYFYLKYLLLIIPTSNLILFSFWKAEKENKKFN